MLKHTTLRNSRHLKPVVRFVIRKQSLVNHHYDQRLLRTTTSKTCRTWNILGWVQLGQVRRKYQRFTRTVQPRRGSRRQTVTTRQLRTQMRKCRKTSMRFGMKWLRRKEEAMSSSWMTTARKVRGALPNPSSEGSLTDAGRQKNTDLINSVVMRESGVYGWDLEKPHVESL